MIWRRLFPRRMVFCGPEPPASRRRRPVARRSCSAVRTSWRKSWRPADSDLRRGVLPDEYRDGGAAVHPRHRLRDPAWLRAALRPVLRHRNDRAADGAARRRGVGAGDRRAGDLRRDRKRASERDPKRSLLRRRRAPRASRARGARRPPDLLVVDPPRAGLSQKVVRRIIEAWPKRIVYVSCNPTTLAPNAAQLVEAGYVLRRVRPRHVPADAAHRVRGAAGARRWCPRPKNRRVNQRSGGWRADRLIRLAEQNAPFVDGSRRRVRSGDWCCRVVVVVGRLSLPLSGRSGVGLSHLSVCEQGGLEVLRGVRVGARFALPVVWGGSPSWAEVLP